jgi:hypothetical protein
MLKLVASHSRRRDPAKNRKHQRAHYWRQKRGIGVARIEYDADVVKLLEIWRPDLLLDNPRVVQAAISQFLRETAEENLRP